MVVVAPRGGSFGGSDSPVRLRDLADLPLIMPSLPHSNRRLVEQAAIQHGARLRPAFEVDSVALTKALVKRGLGCTILTFAAVAAEIAAGELDFRPIHRPPLLSTVAIARSQEARPAWLAATLFNMLREGITELVDSGAWAGARIIATRAT